MSTLAIDTVVWVVKMTVTVKNGTGTVTYYFGLDYWPAGTLYSGSPVIYPLLSKNPTAKRGVGNREGQLAAGLRYDVAIELFGKADFLRLGYGIGDLLNTYEFHGGTAELRFYLKSKNGLATHADATNIRQTLEIYAAKYDDISGLMTLQCRDSWYKDKEFGHRFTTSDFDSNVTDQVNTWRTEPGPIPFGTDATGLRGTVLSVCPLYDSETATSSPHTYQTFKILTGFSPQASSPYKPTFKKLFVRNKRKELNDSEYLEVNLQGNGFASRTPLGGPATLDNGNTELSGKQWRLGRRITPTTKLELISGVTLRTKRVGVINHGDGQLQIVFVEAQEVATNKWSTTGNVVATVPLDASAIGTTPGDVYFHFDPPVDLPPLAAGKSYLYYAEWTKSSTDDKTVIYASRATPIEITTSGEHKWDTGDSVTISGVVGNTAANGTHTITKTADDRFTLNGSVGNGTSAMPITAASKKTPIKITTAAAHGLATGDEVQVSGVKGNTAANGTTTVKVVSSTEFTLDGTVGNDDYVTGGSKNINAATNASPIEITTTANHDLDDGDVVQVSGVLGNTAANGVWRVVRVSATKFYLDGSTGNGTYTSGGTVTWGGVVQKKATAERNKRVSLYYDSAVGTDVFYANDQTVNKDGWAATTGELQMTLWGFGLNDAAGSVTIGDYTLNFAEIHALASGVVPVPFSGLEFKVGVDGLDDDGSGTYTGSANALIDNPAAVIKFILMDTVFGLGLTSARVDTAAVHVVRDDLGSNHDICYALEREMGCEDFILKICNQSRLVIYKTRQGKITLTRPTYPSSFAYNLTEGRLRGEFLLLDVQDNDYSQVINSLEGTYSLDVLNQNTDAAYNRISRDVAYRGLEYIYGNGTGFSTNVRERAVKALDSQRIYGLRSVLMRCDLFDKAAPVQFLLAYLFDRWHRLQRRAKFRVPLKDYHAIDLFSTVRVAAEGIRASIGNASDIPVHYQGEAITIHSDGIPINLWSGGIVEGFVVEIEEEGPFMTLTVETVSPFPSSV